MGQAVIPSDWLGDYCCYSVQWPNSPQWEAVLRGVLALPATGRFWDETTGTITDAQSVIVQTYDNNLHLEEVLMSCNDATNNALNNIAIALNAFSNSGSNTNCCTTPQIQVNNTIQGIAVQPSGGNSIPLYGSTQPLSVTQGDYPSGYDTLEEYETDKCRKANSIVNSVIVSCRAMGAMDAAGFAGLTAIAVMGLSGVLVIAPELIPFLIAALIVLAINISVLDSVADYLVDNKAEFVCILYDGDSSSFIIGALADAIDLMIVALSFSSIVGGAVKVVLLVLFNVDVVNFLFTNAPMFGITEIECSQCGCNETGTIDFYTVDGVTWGSGDLTINCEERVLSANVYAAGTWYFIGLRNNGENDVLVEAISADPSITNNGNFGGMSGFGSFELTPGNNLYWGGQNYDFTMVVKLTGLDTVNGV